MPSDTPARCEPPEALRKGGLSFHWLEIKGTDHPDRFLVATWDNMTTAEDGSSVWGWWLPMEEEYMLPERTARRYRYLSPVPTPSEIAALVRAGRAVNDAAGATAQHMMLFCQDDICLSLKAVSDERRTALSTALAAPSFKEIGDE